MRIRWSILVFIFVFTEALGAPSLESRRQWMGLYLRGEKIGFSYFQVEPQESLVEIVERTSMELLMLGQEKKLTTFTRILGDTNLTLRAFTFELLTGDQRIRMNGRVEEDSLLVNFGAPGEESSRRSFYLGKGVYLPVQITAILSLGKPAPSDFSILDPSTLTLERATLRRKGEEPVEVHGKKKKAALFEMEYLGTPTKVWLKEGIVLRQESPMELVALYETEEEATKTPGKRVDLLYLFAVKPEGKKVNPSDVKSVRLKLTGIKTANLDLDFANQRLLKKGEDWAIVEYTLDAPARPLRDSSLYTEPTSFMQTDAPLIKNKALEIVNGLKSTEEKVKKILEWVYSSLEKKPTVTLPSALEVIESKRGDCNEHSVLFGALARAVGIPTVITVGLVYQEGAYYYHAWDAVYIDGRWVFVDPIFYEYPASPGHLLLKVGEIEKQAELVPVVGSLKIQVLDAKP